MFKKMLLVLIAAMLFSPSFAQAEKKWVTFGAIFPTTGPAALIGDAMKAGTDLALEEVNKKWNGIVINGERHYFKYEHYDDSANPGKSPVGFRKLIDQYNVPFIIGPLGTPQSWAVGPISTEKEILWNAYSAADKTRKMGFTFMMQSRPPANYMGVAMAKAAIDNGLKRFAVLTDISEAYVDWGKMYKKEAERLGGVSVGFESVDTKTISDYHSIMTKFKAAKPDIIVLLAYEEPNSQMVLHAREVGYKGPFFGNPNFTSVLIDIVGAKTVAGSFVDAWPQNYFISKPKEDVTGATTYLYKLYQKKYGSKAWHNIVGNLWDQVLHFIKALEVAQTTTDTLAMRAALNPAAKMVMNMQTSPYNGVLPNGMITGWKDLLCQIQPDGSLKKMGELVTPTSVLRIYENPDDSPFHKLLKKRGVYDKYKAKGWLDYSGL